MHPPQIHDKAHSFPETVLSSPSFPSQSLMAHVTREMKVFSAGQRCCRLYRLKLLIWVFISNEAISTQLHSYTQFTQSAQSGTKVHTTCKYVIS